MSGPFAEMAHVLRSYGLAVIPTGGEDGKKPLLRWGNWRVAPEGSSLSQLVDKFGDCNIGAITRLSNPRLTVADVDDADLAGEMMHLFGDTPLKVQTPSGGMHAYYRHNGEKARNLRSAGLAVDIKCGNAFVNVPTSQRLDGANRGKRYELIEGSWNDLSQLPAMRSGVLEELGSTNLASEPDSQAQTTAINNDDNLGHFERGRRNKDLFHVAQGFASSVEDYDTLLSALLGIIADVHEPLEDWEVEKIAKSVWRYKVEGRLFLPGTQSLVTTADQHAALKAEPNGANASLLLAELRFNHTARDEPFCIAAQRMAEAGVIPGWGLRRYRSATKTLIKLGFIIQVYEGGKGQGDPHRYTFA